MISKINYLKISVSTLLIAGLVFIALDNDDDVNVSKVIVKDEVIESTPTRLKEPQVVKSEQKLVQDMTEAVKEDPFKGREVKYRFQQVAAQFAEDIKYPTFSKPIRNENELIKYLPNQGLSSDMAINIDDPGAAPLEDSPQISLKTSKFRYYKGEPILAEAEITGLDAGSYVSVSVYAMVDKKVIANASEVTRSDSEREQNDHHYAIRFDDLSHFASDYKGEMRIVAEFTVDGQAFAISSQVGYPNIVATLDRVGSAEVQAEYLQIPMYINTSEPGLHAISGNLYDAESGTPLVHLSAVEELSSESGVIFLKAHIVALKKMGYEGPYELKDISLSRGPSAPRNVTEQGLVEVESVSIGGFSFSEYEDIPYVDERAQARLNFLTQLGSTD